MIGVDLLIDRIDALGNPSAVGLDPALAMMPDALAAEMYGAYGRTPRAVSEMFLLYNKAIIDAVCDIVPAVKPQIAMYEKFGLDGLSAYIRTCEYAASKGLYVIGDIKRGDIASTAEAYAAHLSGVDIGAGIVADPDADIGAGTAAVDLWHEDAITVNPYLGTDGIAPFTEACRETGKTIFVLVKTSNKSSAELQDLVVSAGAGGGTSSEAPPPHGNGPGTAAGSTAAVGTATGTPLYEHVGRLVEGWGADLIGGHGYSAVGAVVGATHPAVGTRLRELMPHTFFLVPGYGAQGASAKDLRGFFDAAGRGCIISSSRGIIAAWQRSAGDGSADANDMGKALKKIAAAARAAALLMKDDITSEISYS